jgi:hypothetical protein
MKLTLQEICGMMHAKGYRYASLSDGPPPLGGRLHSGPKPAHTWYFSRIDDGYGEYSAYVEEGECSLGWVDWLKSEHFHVPEYAAKSISFAKFDFDKLVTEDTNMSKYISSNSPSFTKYYHWDQMRNDGFDGVYVDRPEHRNWNGAGWDVPTIGVWKLEGCVSDIKTFKNAGEWEYTVHMDDIGSNARALLYFMESLHKRVKALEETKEGRARGGRDTV